MFEGFILAYQERKLSFDETYYDACVALSQAALRGPGSEEARVLIEPIETALKVPVSLQGGRFYLLRKDGSMEGAPRRRRAPQDRLPRPHGLERPADDEWHPLR